jgi:hypothetical protein
MTQNGLRLVNETRPRLHEERLMNSESGGCSYVMLHVA